MPQLSLHNWMNLNLSDSFTASAVPVTLAADETNNNFKRSIMKFPMLIALFFVTSASAIHAAAPAKKSEPSESKLEKSPSSSSPSPAKKARKPLKIDTKSSLGKSLQNDLELYHDEIPSPIQKTINDALRTGRQVRRALEHFDVDLQYEEDHVQLHAHVVDGRNWTIEASLQPDVEHQREREVRDFGEKNHATCTRLLELYILNNVSQPAADFRMVYGKLLTETPKDIRQRIMGTLQRLNIKTIRDLLKVM
jgi:hypothetical protein